MRLALALAFVLALVSGCAGESCCNEWSFQGDDTQLYGALAGVAGVNETRDAGWGVRDARLDELWGEYALVSVIDVNGISLSGRSGERVQLTAGAAPDAEEASLRGNVTAFLRATVDSDDETYGRIVDALLANATPLDGGGMPHEAGATPPPASSNVTYYHYATEFSEPLRAQALFDELTTQEGWIPEESFGRDQGSVEVAAWTFLFTFPMRVLDTPDLYLSVNAHGGLLGRVDLEDDVGEADARREVATRLEARGAFGVDPSAWAFAGTHVGGPAPPGASPTPTA